MEIKKIFNPYVDKRKEFMKDTQFKVEDLFGDLKNKGSISPEQLTKHNNFSAKLV